MLGSLSARRAWIEMFLGVSECAAAGSLSARRAWIEISEDWLNAGSLSVALRKESVDRNLSRLLKKNRSSVVALRKESVDRNTLLLVLIFLKIGSLSARRAWIEMLIFALWMARSHVALRKESVDRNVPDDGRRRDRARSLSARRAWIEISGNERHHIPKARRSPQGERG